MIRIAVDMSARCAAVALMLALMVSVSGCKTSDVAVPVTDSDIIVVDGDTATLKTESIARPEATPELTPEPAPEPAPKTATSAEESVPAETARAEDDARARAAARTLADAQKAAESKIQPEKAKAQADAQAEMDAARLAAEKEAAEARAAEEKARLEKARVEKARVEKARVEKAKADAAKNVKDKHAGAGTAIVAKVKDSSASVVIPSVAVRPPAVGEENVSWTDAVVAPVDNRELLRVGISPNYAPVIYTQGGHVFGMEVDNARGLAEALDRRLGFVAFSNPVELIDALNSDKIDIIMSGMTYTEERARQVLFVSSFVKVPLGVLVRADEKANYLDGRDVRGANVSIAVKKNTTGHAYAKKFCYGGRDDIVFVTQDQAAEAVLSREVGFFIHDLPSVRFIASAYEDELAFVDFDLQPQYLGWAVSQKNKTLHKAVNKVFEQWEKSGALAENIGRWLPELGEGIEGEDRVGRQPPFTGISIKADAPEGTMATIMIDGKESSARDIDIGSARWEMFYLMPGEHELQFSAEGYKSSTHAFTSKKGQPSWEKFKVSK